MCCGFLGRKLRGHCRGQRGGVLSWFLSETETGGREDLCFSESRKSTVVQRGLSFRILGSAAWPQSPSHQHQALLVCRGSRGLRAQGVPGASRALVTLCSVLCLSLPLTWLLRVCNGWGWSGE